MPGRVGSLFGLNPYSSTSLRRSSSAALFALRLRQKKRAAKIIRATETTGTTTATAMVPLVERPEEAAAAVEVDCAADSVALEDAMDEEPVSVGVAVDVTMTTVVPPVLLLETEETTVDSGVEVVDG